MFIKEVSASTCQNEIELQRIAAKYGFAPKIINKTIIHNKCFIHMEDLETECLANVYGEDPEEIPEWIWDQIRIMIRILVEEEGIEYPDITPYNFIEKNERIYIVDFGDAKYINGDISWFVQEFIDGENSWNPDYK
jgi:tRNA A-37 threonylcarbamoyl transferase component Bud32